MKTAPRLECCNRSNSPVQGLPIHWNPFRNSWVTEVIQKFLPRRLTLSATPPVQFFAPYIWQMTARSIHFRRQQLTLFGRNGWGFHQAKLRNSKPILQPQKKCKIHLATFPLRQLANCFCLRVQLFFATVFWPFGPQLQHTPP